MPSRLGPVAVRAKEGTYESVVGHAPDVGRLGRVGHRDDGDDAARLGRRRRGIVLGIRWPMGQGREPQGDTAMDILRQRYARGDVTKEEFVAWKRDLGQ